MSTCVRVEPYLTNRSCSLKAGGLSRADASCASSIRRRKYGIQHKPKDPEQWADFIVKGWMKSPGHRKNILNAKFNYLGVAVWECCGK